MAEAFNLFNRLNYASVNNTISCDPVGRWETPRVATSATSYSASEHSAPTASTRQASRSASRKHSIHVGSSWLCAFSFDGRPVPLACLRLTSTFPGLRKPTVESKNRRGLRPWRSFLSFTTKLPNPRMSTRSFDRSASAISSRTESSATSTSAFPNSVLAAIFSINCCLSFFLSFSRFSVGENAAAVPRTRQHRWPTAPESHTDTQFPSPTVPLPQKRGGQCLLTRVCLSGSVGRRRFPRRSFLCGNLFRSGFLCGCWLRLGRLSLTASASLWQQ